MPSRWQEIVDQGVDGDHTGADLRPSWIGAGQHSHDTPSLFDWLVHVLSFQGIADAIAAGFIEQHGIIHAVCCLAGSASFVALPATGRMVAPTSFAVLIRLAQSFARSEVGQCSPSLS